MRRGESNILPAGSARLQQCLDGHVAEILVYDRALGPGCLATIEQYLSHKYSVPLVTSDRDNDGLPDEWEFAHFMTLDQGPDDDPDHDGIPNDWELELGLDPSVPMEDPPASIGGTVAYSGGQTGPIVVVAATDPDSFQSPYSVVVAEPGTYLITSSWAPNEYWVRAYRDSNGNGTNDPWEAQGEYAGNSMFLLYDTNGIDVVLSELDSDGDGLPDWWELAHGLDPYALSPADLAGWWKLDEAEGTLALDSSTYANHGLVDGALHVPGRVGLGLSFDGTNDTLVVSNSAAYKPVRLTASVRGGLGSDLDLGVYKEGER